MAIFNPQLLNKMVDYYKSDKEFSEREEQQLSAEKKKKLDLEKLTLEQQFAIAYYDRGLALRILQGLNLPEGYFNTQADTPEEKRALRDKVNSPEYAVISKGLSDLSVRYSDDLAVSYYLRIAKQTDQVQSLSDSTTPRLLESFVLSEKIKPKLSAINLSLLYHLRPEQILSDYLKPEQLKKNSSLPIKMNYEISSKVLVNIPEREISLDRVLHAIQYSHPAALSEMLRPGFFTRLSTAFSTLIDGHAPLTHAHEFATGHSLAQRINDDAKQFKNHPDLFDTHLVEAFLEWKLIGNEYWKQLPADYWPQLMHSLLVLLGEEHKLFILAKERYASVTKKIFNKEVCAKFGDLKPEDPSADAGTRSENVPHLEVAPVNSQAQAPSSPISPSVKLEIAGNVAASLENPKLQSPISSPVAPAPKVKDYSVFDKEADDLRRTLLDSEDQTFINDGINNHASVQVSPVAASPVSESKSEAPQIATSSTPITPAAVSPVKLPVDSASAQIETAFTQSEIPPAITLAIAPNLVAIPSELTLDGEAVVASPLPSDKPASVPSSPVSPSVKLETAANLAASLEESPLPQTPISSTVAPAFKDKDYSVFDNEVGDLRRMLLDSEDQILTNDGINNHASVQASPVAASPVSESKTEAPQIATSSTPVAVTPAKQTVDSISTQKESAFSQSESPLATTLDIATNPFTTPSALTLNGDAVVAVPLPSDKLEDSHNSMANLSRDNHASMAGSDSAKKNASMANFTHINHASMPSNADSDKKNASMANLSRNNNASMPSNPDSDKKNASMANLSYDDHASMAGHSDSDKKKHASMANLSHDDHATMPGHSDNDKKDNSMANLTKNSNPSMANLSPHSNLSDRSNTDSMPLPAEESPEAKHGNGNRNVGRILDFTDDSFDQSGTHDFSFQNLNREEAEKLMEEASKQIEDKNNPAWFAFKEYLSETNDSYFDNYVPNRLALEKDPRWIEFSESLKLSFPQRIWDLLFYYDYSITAENASSPSPHSSPSPYNSPAAVTSNHPLSEQQKAAVKELSAVFSPIAKQTRKSRVQKPYTRDPALNYSPRNLNADFDAAASPSKPALFAIRDNPILPATPVIKGSPEHNRSMADLDAQPGANNSMANLSAGSPLNKSMPADNDDDKEKNGSMAALGDTQPGASDSMANLSTHLESSIRLSAAATVSTPKNEPRRALADISASRPGTPVPHHDVQQLANEFSNLFAAIPSPNKALKAQMPNILGKASPLADQENSHIAAVDSEPPRTPTKGEQSGKKHLRKVPLSPCKLAALTDSPTTSNTPSLRSL